MTIYYVRYSFLGWNGPIGGPLQDQVKEQLRLALNFDPVGQQVSTLISHVIQAIIRRDPIPLNRLGILIHDLEWLQDSGETLSVVSGGGAVHYPTIEIPGPPAAPSVECHWTGEDLAGREL